MTTSYLWIAFCDIFVFGGQEFQKVENCINNSMNIYTIIVSKKKSLWNLVRLRFIVFFLMKIYFAPIDHHFKDRFGC